MSPGYSGGLSDLRYGKVIISSLVLLALSLRLQDDAHASILASSIEVVEMLDAGISR